MFTLHNIALLGIASHFNQVCQDKIKLVLRLLNIVLFTTAVQSINQRVLKFSFENHYANKALLVEDVLVMQVSIQRSSPYVTLIKLSSSLEVIHHCFRHASPHLWNQHLTSLRIPYPNYSSPSQRPSFEHAGLTCYTLLSHSITFSLFLSQLKTYLFRKSYPPPQSVSVCRTDLMALDRLLDFLFIGFYVLVPFLYVLVIFKCGRLSWPALWSTFWAHEKIAID